MAGRLLLAIGAISLALAPAGRAEPALPDALTAGWQGQKVCELLHQTATNRVLRCTFPPGVGHERHFHPPHFGYALSGGRMRITTAEGTREVEIKRGSSFTSKGVPWHVGHNVGKTTVTYLMVEERATAD